MSNHAHTPTSTLGAPPFSRPTATQSKTAIPKWEQLDLEVRQTLVNLLTRMIQHQLPSPSLSDGKEVADESS